MIKPVNPCMHDPPGSFSQVSEKEKREGMKMSAVKNHIRIT